MKTILVIPARYQSSRFPGKPLVDICGKSMILRVWEKCAQAFSKEQVFVATDSDKIEDHCQSHGIQVVMTSSRCLTGTDRLCEVAQEVDADLYLNVQGDEPMLNPDDIRKVWQTACDHPGEIVNAMCDIDNEQDFRSPTVPKVVARPDGRLMYMSRAAIPTTKSLSFENAKKQVCIYAFPKKALLEFGACTGKTPLESLEDIEILRFLELGYEIKMVEVSQSSIAVDTPDDVKRVEEALHA